MERNGENGFFCSSVHVRASFWQSVVQPRYVYIVLGEMRTGRIYLEVKIRTSSTAAREKSLTKEIGFDLY